MVSAGEEEGDSDDEILLRLGHASAAGTIAQGPRAGMRIPPSARLGAIVETRVRDRRAGLPTRAPPIETARPLDEPELDFA